MLRSSLFALLLTSCFGLVGCQNNRSIEPALARHVPEILVVNRAKKTENATTPWVKGAQLVFPAIDAAIGPYWIIFVDQSPCAPGTNATNPLAYQGEPGKPPSCIVNIDPPSGSRDRHFRYALWPHSLGPLPPYEQVYARSTCPPICQ